MLYSECHQGQHHHCLHSFKFTSFCSANLWLIVKSFVSFDPVYPCCCIVCDLPTELSRSNHSLTLTSSGWDTLQKLQTSVTVHEYIFINLGRDELSLIACFCPSMSHTIIFTHKIFVIVFIQHWEHKHELFYELGFC